MNKKTKGFFGILARYTIIILVSIGNLKLFYRLLTPVTIKVLAMVLRPFYDIIIVGNLIYGRGITIEIASSCIMAPAFFLMFLLVFSTPDIKPKKRIRVLVVSFVILFIYNIGRIVFLVSIIHSPHFDTIHWILQNLVSMVVVAIIWIGMASLLKIKTVPVCSDLKNIYGLIKKSKH